MITFKQYISEQVDKKDTITLDIPLLIRVLELAREDVKSDAELHKVVERLIDIRNKGTLTMDDYDFIAHLKESVLDEHIVKSGGQYKLVSKKTGKNLGTYSSKSGAENRERQVQYFKHMGEDGGAMGGSGGPTVVTGPQSSTDPVSATAVNKKRKVVLQPLQTRTPPKM